MSQCKICVLLACYNGAEFLVEQCQSILDQIGVDVSIYINVDLSSDGSEVLAAQLQKNDDRVHLLPIGNVFGSSAKNFFHLLMRVDFSPYDYVAFADQDDVWFPDKLHTAVNVLDLQSCDGYSSNVYAWWPGKKRTLIKKSQCQKQFDHFFEAAGPGCTYVLQPELAREVQKELNHLDRSLKLPLFDRHDWFVYAFARSRNFKWVTDSSAKMLYRQHDRNVVGANVGFAAYVRRLKQIFARWYICQSLNLIEVLDPSLNARINQFTFLFDNCLSFRRRKHHSFFVFLLLVYRRLLWPRS